MVQDIISFIMAHWLLCSAFAILLIALFVEEARSKGLMGQISPQEAVKLMNHESAVVIDIRDRNAYQDGHIIGAVNIPRADLEKDLSKMDKYKNQAVIIVCAMGQTAGALSAKLKKQAFPNIHVLSGGMHAWKNAQMPVVKK